ncbi:hypothetical protein ABKV19_009480 [Rosa sericea]
MADVQIEVENATQNTMTFYAPKEWHGKHKNPFPSSIESGTKVPFSHTPDVTDGSVAAVVYHGKIGTEVYDHMFMWSSLTSSKDANKVWAMTRKRGFFTDAQLQSILDNLKDNSHTDDSSVCQSFITIVNDTSNKTTKVEAKFTSHQSQSNTCP